MIRDPRGQPLSPTLVEVIERDEHERPTTCRVRYDDETIDLTSSSRQFLLVWVPSGASLERCHPAEQLLELTRAADALRESVTETRRSLASASEEIARVVEENRQKTEALRELQRERDPERVERLVAERVERAMRAHVAELDAKSDAILARDREIAELRAAKRKLRDALDRLKMPK